MPCHTAMHAPFTISSPDEPLENVLAAMDEQGTTVVAICNEQQQLEGYFTKQILLKNILPVSVNTADPGVLSEISLPAAPNVARRYEKALVQPIYLFMNRNVRTIIPEAQLWEGVKLLTDSSEPLFVIDHETHKLMGMMTPHTVTEELERLKDGKSL